MKCSLHALLLVVLCSCTAAQQVPPNEPPAAPASHRPAIGLVLEGGVDYIAGTSMGGLVGGLYATGMSGDELDKFVQGINWNRSLRNELPYSARSFRRKEDKRDYPNDLEFGLKHGISFPSGFNSGHQVGLILDRVALPYSDLKSFDDLPRPFRCVATDLVSSKAAVFNQGSLSEALRSTMSLSAIFSPVRRDRQIYVDGGLLDNLPVDVARAMG
ncbi:MAG TPA: patatin-like phospholipase family protein, partial [Terriglobales bacterium]|nr:patatin-like phospholipase family protein [Terriglobales bacterium]